jgi:hypothetical protein
MVHTSAPVVELRFHRRSRVFLYRYPRLGRCLRLGGFQHFGFVRFRGANYQDGLDEADERLGSEPGIESMSDGEGFWTIPIKIFGEVTW